MTQAFNLSQLANKVNTSGQLDASTGLVNATPIAAGGTNNGSLAVTAGGVLYTDGSKVVNVGAGTSGQALLSQGSGAPIWGSAGATGTLKNIQYFTVSGTYTPTSGTTFVIVEVVGGGGGGAQKDTYPGGGGGGGYAIKKITSGFSGVTVTIGAGGATTFGASNASGGGTSSFGALISATGGGGGTSNGTSSSAAGGTGGNGSGGDLNIQGQAGFAALSAFGSSVSAGGSPAKGYGIGGVSSNTTSSVAASGYGAGGCGKGASTVPAINGTSGIVIVYEYA